MPEFLITLLAVVFLVIAGVSLVGCAGLIGSVIEDVRSQWASSPVGRAGKRIA